MHIREPSSCSASSERWRLHRVLGTAPLRVCGNAQGLLPLPLAPKPCYLPLQSECGFALYLSAAGLWRVPRSQGSGYACHIPCHVCCWPSVCCHRRIILCPRSLLVFPRFRLWSQVLSLGLPVWSHNVKNEFKCSSKLKICLCPVVT